MVIRMGKSLVCGVGLNDADYVVSPNINGSQHCCIIYQCWLNMIKRCYSTTGQLRNPTYFGCYVCEQWLLFSSFRKWWIKQNSPGKALDKDIISPGNKIYSPEFCSLVNQATNNFVTENKFRVANLPVGVAWKAKNQKYVAQCRNPFTHKNEHLGLFTHPEQAHLAWKNRKHELACQLADLQTDQRVAQALRTRYL